jgi:hypothetical protein
MMNEELTILCFWYWGHLHNGIAYTRPVNISNGETTWSTNTYCRCLGNGSMPYGTPTELVQQPSENIEWFAGMGSPVQELENGYVSLNFEINEGKVVKIFEDFYIATDQILARRFFSSHDTKKRRMSLYCCHDRLIFC